jgi:MFS family permease
MLIDLSPLKRYREFRLLFSGQLTSDLGSAFTYVALPYQMYQLTHSSLAVGLIGICQLVPLLATALIGGVLADAANRRALLITAELGLAACSALLAGLAFAGLAKPIAVYLLAGVMSGLKGIHRPSLEAITPRLVPKEELLPVSALMSLRRNLAAIGGPALAGLVLAAWGLGTAYAIDAASYLISLATLSAMRAVPQGKVQALNLGAVAEGLRYAASRQELLGTYLVDIIAMIFGMPMALFPEIADRFGGAAALGWLYTAPEAGALIATTFSGWTKRVKRHGRAIVFAAAAWGAAIVAFGLTHRFLVAIVFLGLAGAADMLSGLFRMTVWNETIPDHLRGRMAGIEMVSYMTGPLLGNAEAGLVAAGFGTTVSVVSGGALCVAGVIACGLALRRFWDYRTSI